MKNKKNSSDVAGYISDELNDNEKLKFEKILLENTELRDELKTAKNLKSIIDNLPDYTPPLDLTNKIIETAKNTQQTDVEKPNFKLFKKKIQKRYYFRLAATAAIILVVFLIGFNALQKKNPDRPTRIEIASITNIRGVVLISNEITKVPRRIVAGDTFTDGSIITTKSDSKAKIVSKIDADISDNIFLADSTETKIISPKYMSFASSKFKLQNIELNKGRIYCDVAPRIIEMKTSKSADEVKNFQTSPFTVITQNAELKVRGTKFFVDYNPELKTTYLFVSKGRVDLFSKNNFRNIASVNEGEFCLLGPQENINQYCKSYTQTDMDGEVIYHKASVEVEAFVIDKTRIKFILRNNMFADIKLGSSENADNLRIRYEFPKANKTEVSWGYVHKISRSLKPGEKAEFEYNIPELLRTNTVGDYYFQAVYNGNIEISQIQPFSVDSQDVNSWQIMRGEWFSKPNAVFISPR